MVVSDQQTHIITFTNVTNCTLMQKKSEKGNVTMISNHDKPMRK